MIKLNPLNQFLFPFHVKSINSIKFSHSLVNLQQKSLRSYVTTNDYNASSPLYYDSINRNNRIIDFSSESIEIIRNRLRTSGKLAYKFDYNTTKKLREAAVLMVRKKIILFYILCILFIYCFIYLYTVLFI
jgi:hypothetical protein